MLCFSEVFAVENNFFFNYLNVGSETSEKANYPKVYHYRIVDVKVTSRAEC